MYFLKQNKKLFFNQANAQCDDQYQGHGSILSQYTLARSGHSARLCVSGSVSRLTLL